MDKEKNGKEKERNKNTSHCLKVYRQMNRHTRYIEYERNQGKTVLFDERYIQDTGKSTLIENVIAARKIHIALNQALEQLPDDEAQIIDECFFLSEKVNYTKLAEKHGVSRQAYTQRKDRILKKLKKLVISNYKKL